MVDILHVDEEGVDIYEVKYTTPINRGLHVYAIINKLYKCQVSPCCIISYINTKE